jgi:hypothetical protein
MSGCLRRSEKVFAFALAFALGAAGAAGCSTRVLTVVGPDPCADGGAGPGCVTIPPGLLDGLVGYWRFEDGVGSKTAHDSSGRGNDGTLEQLDPTKVWVPGRSGDALAVYGAGWVGVVPSPSIDAITDRITMSAWVYFDGTISATDTWGTAISREIGTTIDQHYHLSLHMDGRPSMFLTTPAGSNPTGNLDLVMGPDAVPQKTWVHLAGTYDGATARLYVDGALVASQPMTGTFAADTSPLIIGGNGNDASGVPTELFPGRLDEIMLYGRALSDTEIAQLHDGVLFPGGATPDAGATD